MFQEMSRHASFQDMYTETGKALPQTERCPTPWAWNVRTTRASFVDILLLSETGEDKYGRRFATKLILGDLVQK